MALKLCPNCRLPIHETATECPQCAAPVRAAAQTTPDRRVPIAAALAVVATIAVLTRRSG